MLATMRKDGGRVTRPSGEGTIETVPVKCDGADLFVCADVKPGGSIRAEVLGVDGLSVKDCNPVTMDVSDGKLTWSEKNLEEWIGSKITLRFHLNKATLYSFLTK